MDQQQYHDTVLMRRAQIEDKVSNGDYDAEYAAFIIEKSAGERIICNGDTLIAAMESGYYFDRFCDYLEDK